MRKSILLLLLSVILFSTAFSQATGDYRSAASGNWNAAATWQRFNGTSWVAAPAPPTTLDGVVTILGHTITMTANAEIDQLAITAGIIQGTFVLTISGSGNTWSSGTINAPVTVASLATFSLSSSVNLNDVLTIETNANFNWTAGSILLNEGTINNNGTITLTNASGSSFNSGGGTNAFNNNSGGVLTKSSGAGILTSNIPVNNAGTFNINISSYSQTGNTLTNTGTVNIAPTATFTNSATANFNTGTSVTGNGTIALSGGTHNVNTALTTPAGITVNLSAGTLQGSGSLTINKTLNWSGGMINLPTNIANAANLELTSSVNLNDILTIQNGGSFNWSAGSILMNEGTINNNGTITLTNAGGSSFNSGGGTNAFNNNSGGVLTKSSGAGILTSNIPVNNAGTFNINISSYSQTGNTFINTGTLNIASTATFTNSATANFNTGTSVTGNGTIALSGGTHNVNTALTTPAGITVNLSAGTLQGSGSLTINKTLNWSGGMINLPTNIANAANLELTSSVNLNDILTIQNGGSFNWSAGSILMNDGTINNNGTITLTNASGVSLNSSGGTNAFNNNINGVFRKISGAGIFTSNVSTNNSGMIAGIGSLSFTGAFSNTGSISPGLSPGILTCNSTTVNLFTVSSTLIIELQDGSGAGTGHDQLQRNSSLTLAGLLTVTETGTVPSGDYVVISLTSGTVTGTFTTTNLPAGYSVIYNTNNVVVRKGALATWYRDFDNDTYGDPNNSTQGATQPTGYVANNTDCNDNNANIYPGATEVCNGVDDDCDGLIDEGVQTTFYRDFDGDGFGNAAVTQQGCAAPAGYVANNTDCNDNNANINPNATEVCNGVDDDCDGLIDEGVQTTFYRDLDGDGFGNAAVTQQACSAPVGYVVNSSDCNDNNANINPNATEVCNGVDDDCDGLIDEGVQTTFYRDLDGDGFGNAAVTQQACSTPAGYVANSTDCNDNNINIYPGAAEICNGIDDDCDGQIDEGAQPVTWYRDLDGDGFGNPAVTQSSCTQPSGFVLNNTDCNDNNANINPTATEVCNGVDDDCDGLIDEGVQTTFYRDLDGDGFGNAAVTQQACSTPAGYVANSTDCNDNNINIYPGAAEICNGIDDDCDGQIDEGAQPVTWYRDLDGDGFGNPAVTQSSCTQPSGFVLNNTDCNDNNANINPNTVWYLDADNDNYYTGAGITQCTSPGAGYKFSGLIGGNDCNDGNPNIHPAATEICDGLDNDCDGQVDEGAQPVNWYLDLDSDGFGNPAVSQLSCTQPTGYVLNNTDCNDNNAAINPNTVWYLDADNDNYYTGSGITQCTSPGAGYKFLGLTAGGDCNDNNPNINPAATEVCNGVDDDCDGQVDEGVKTTFYQDADGNGFGNPAVSQLSCTQPTGYVLNNTDCNDNNAAINPNTVWYLDADNDNYYTGSGITQCTSPGAGYRFSGLTAGGDCNDNNPNIHPGATEVCNGVEDDCDGQTDEGCAGDNDSDGFTVAQGDCNDNDNTVYPGAPELCDGKDNDCDVLVDENFPTTEYRSKQSGNWNDASSWEASICGNWQAAGTAPPANAIITIGHGHTITANTNVSAGQITIDNGGHLVVAANTFSISGLLTIQSGGRFSFHDNTIINLQSNARIDNFGLITGSAATGKTITIVGTGNLNNALNNKPGSVSEFTGGGKLLLNQSNVNNEGDMKVAMPETEISGQNSSLKTLAGGIIRYPQGGNIRGNGKFELRGNASSSRADQQRLTNIDPLAKLEINKDFIIWGPTLISAHATMIGLLLPAVAHVRAKQSTKWDIHGDNWFYVPVTGEPGSEIYAYPGSSIYAFSNWQINGNSYWDQSSVYWYDNWAIYGNLSSSSSTWRQMQQAKTFRCPSSSRADFYGNNILTRDPAVTIGSYNFEGPANIYDVLTVNSAVDNKPGGIFNVADNTTIKIDVTGGISMGGTVNSGNNILIHYLGNVDRPAVIIRDGGIWKAKKITTGGHLTNNGSFEFIELIFSNTLGINPRLVNAGNVFIPDNGTISGNGQFFSTGGNVNAESSVTYNHEVQTFFSNTNQEGQQINYLGQVTFAGNTNNIYAKVYTAPDGTVSFLLSSTTNFYGPATFDGNASMSGTSNLGIGDKVIFNKKFFGKGGGHKLTRLGVRGSEDMGGGLTAIFQIESPVIVDVPFNSKGETNGRGPLIATNPFFFKSFASLKPGSSPGLFTLGLSNTSDILTLPSNTILNIELQDANLPAGEGYDRLHVTSNLNLNGSTMAVTALPDIPNGSSFIVVTSDGLLTGKFGNVNLPQGYKIIYTPNSVIVEKAANCNGVTASIVILGNKNRCPVTMQASPGGPNASYQWFKNNILIVGATDRRYTATTSGSYTVQVTTNNGCVDMSDPVLITSCPTGELRIYTNTDITTEQQPVITKNSLKIYPNPASDHIIIELMQDENYSGDATVQLVSLRGEVLMTQKLNVLKGGIYGKLKLNSKWKDDLYLVKVIVNKKIYTGRVIKINP